VLPVALRAARIGEDDDIPLRREVLEFMEPARAIRRGRPAMNFEEERILLRGIEAGWLHNPSLYLLARRLGWRQGELFYFTEVNVVRD
jgi:hypothetical protein